jgi:hypothetical protein
VEYRVVRFNGKNSPIFALQERVDGKWVNRAKGSRFDMRAEMIRRTAPAVATPPQRVVGWVRRVWRRVFRRGR